MRAFTSATWSRGAIAALALALSGPAAADVVTIDLTALQSVDFFGDADNDTLSIDLNAALGTIAEVTVEGIGWDVTIDTIGGSWLSEARISFQDSLGGEHLQLAPGIDDTFAGSGVYSSGGILDLVSAGLSFTLADGILVLEFFESFDDMAGMVDANWGGTLTISATGVVPVPAGVWLLLSGIGVLAGRGFTGRNRG